MKINISAFKNFRDFIEDKEWKIVVVASIISFLFVLVLNAYFFLHISKEADKTSGPETGFSIIVFKRELFEKTLDNLQKKEQYFNQGLLVKPAIPDPSL